MQWLSVVLAVITLIVRVTDALAKKKAVADAEAEIVRQFLGQARQSIQAASLARKAANKLNADPNRLRDDDGFKRD